MTSAQTMLETTRAILARATGRRLALIALAALLTGCRSGPQELTLVPPRVTVAPYDTTAGEILWAVVPPRNESGTLAVDPLRIGDKLVAAVQEVHGLSCLPLNRTIEAMRALDMSLPTTTAEIHRLAEALGVDGILVGSITAYDPYDPPVLGLSLALYSRGDAMKHPSPDLASTRTLTHQPVELSLPRSQFTHMPAGVVSEHMDARNHDILRAVQTYAHGRDDPRLAFGWRRYTASMDLYTQFGAARAVERLLDREHARLLASAPEERTPD
ncbi:MAG: hypothetical protein KF866_02350 [Phycisphaeraceae bacterium]|nr:hypothetical protein [Phycisphaeraceae bacterium]MCW5753465.1 hypothetical protein [Phycisphaeraceae bacterium]